MPRKGYEEIYRETKTKKTVNSILGGGFQLEARPVTRWSSQERLFYLVFRGVDEGKSLAFLFCLLLGNFISAIVADNLR